MLHWLILTPLKQRGMQHKMRLGSERTVRGVNGAERLGRNGRVRDPFRLYDGREAEFIYALEKKLG